MPEKVNIYQFISSCLITGNEKYLWF